MNQENRINHDLGNLNCVDRLSDKFMNHENILGKMRQKGMRNSRILRYCGVWKLLEINLPQQTY